MPPHFPDVSPFVFAIGRVAGAKVSGDKHALLLTVLGLADDAQGANGEQSEGQQFSGVGDYGWPEPPDSDGAYCDAINLRYGDTLIPVSFRDLRLSKRMNPKQGDVGKVHYGGGFINFSWTPNRDGTVVVLLSPHLDGNGNIDHSHALVMDPSPSNANVTLQHQLGNAFVLDKDGSAKMVSSDGKTWVSVGPNGYAVSSDKGQTFVGGVIAGQPPSALPAQLNPPLVTFLNALLSALATAFSTNAINGAPLDPAWATTTIAVLNTALAQMTTDGAATTLKASPM